MKPFKIYPSFGVAIQKFTDGQFNLIFVCRKETKTKFEKVGHFIKQEDGTFDFVFPTDREKSNFAEIIQSENPIEAFNRIYGK